MSDTYNNIQPSMGQGTAGSTDVVTQLQGIIRQIQQGNVNVTAQLALIVSALLGVNVASYTVATLPSSPAIGNMAAVTDGGAALAWGATVTGGGSAKYLCWYNGANWTVVGK